LIRPTVELQGFAYGSLPIPPCEIRRYLGLVAGENAACSFKVFHGVVVTHYCHPSFLNHNSDIHRLILAVLL